MIAHHLRTFKTNGLFKVMSGRYLLLKINSTQVKRYDLVGDKEYDSPLDIENYNHCLVAEIPLAQIIINSRKGRRHDSQANKVHEGLLHSRILQGRLNAPPRRAGT
jgi:hypothetical protein